tara:strand:+ start:142 stop:405 length:264 start_codon:yes stop_codon:yes gene_type:complete
MTSHENTLKQALMGLSKLQLPILNDISEKDIRETQLEENAENKINNLTDEQKKEIGEFRLGIIRNTIKRHPDVDPYETHKMMREMGY